MVDDGAKISIGPPELDAMRRRFRTVLRATCGEDEVLAMDLSGSIETAIPVVVPVHAIKMGEVVTEDDLTLASIAESKVPANAIMRIEEASGQEARAPLASAVPIPPRRCFGVRTSSIRGRRSPSISPRAASTSRLKARPSDPVHSTDRVPGPEPLVACGAVRLGDW